MEEKEKYDLVFENELLPHIDALKTFAFHLSLNESDANDLVQETYLKAYRFIDKYNQGTNSKAWLFKILKNAYINEYRKKGREPQKVDFDEVYNFAHSENSPVIYENVNDLLNHDMGDEITLAIDSLPLDYKTVILLCDVEDFTYEEISKIIEVPIGTVRSRLFRARNLLKNKLAKYAKERGYIDRRGDKN